MRLSAIIGAVALVFASFGAYAQHAPMQRMSVEQILLLANGLKGLDHYHFDPEVRVTIAHDLFAIRSIVANYTATREAMISKYAQGTNKVPENEVAAFNAEDRKILSQTFDIAFLHITQEQLKLEQNDIPPGTLALLLPILD